MRSDTPTVFGPEISSPAHAITVSPRATTRTPNAVTNVSYRNTRIFGHAVKMPKNTTGIAAAAHNQP